MTSYNPNDAKHGYCANCRQFGFEVIKHHPVDLGLIYGNILRCVRHLITDTPFVIGFERFGDEDLNTGKPWRAFIRIGLVVHAASERPHPAPEEALRELEETLIERTAHRYIQGSP